MRIVENLYNYFPYKKSFLLEFKNAKNEVKKEWIIDTTYKSPVEYSTKTISFDSGIAYVNISNVDYKLFSKNIDKINASKGLIIDLRNYPTYSTLKTLGHFTDSILEPGQWQTYKIRYPDQKRLEYKKVVPWKIKPAKPRIKVPVVVLIGRDNYSFGETCLEIIKHYHLGTLIGETSGGTNGDINFGYINSSFVLIWTGMKVTQRDGSRFMGVGVEPDIRVHTTRNEYIHGRDGVYDAAIEFLKKGRGIK